MKHALAVMLALVGLVFAVDSLSYPMGDLRDPGPGWFPGILGLVLMGLSAILTLDARDRVTGHGLVRSDITITSASIVMITLTPWLGIWLCAMVSMLIMAQPNSSISWLRSILWCMLASLGLTLMIVGLDIALPVWPGGVR